LEKVRTKIEKIHKEIRTLLYILLADGTIKARVKETSLFIYFYWRTEDDAWVCKSGHCMTWIDA
jgi:hypothetical protein